MEWTLKAKRVSLRSLLAEIKPIKQTGAFSVYTEMDNVCVPVSAYMSARVCACTTCVYQATVGLFVTRDEKESLKR